MLKAIESLTTNFSRRRFFTSAPASLAAGALALPLAVTDPLQAAGEDAELIALGRQLHEIWPRASYSNVDAPIDPEFFDLGEPIVAEIGKHFAHTVDGLAVKAWAIAFYWLKDNGKDNIIFDWSREDDCPAEIRLAHSLIRSLLMMPHS